jgi:cell division protein YceG involved in septum cleavage
VYWNRLDERTAGETAGFLNADPTVIYGADTLALEELPLNEWPQHVFWDSLPQSPAETTLPPRLASFQTYQNKGLPDWPIATPSRESLDAALEPSRKGRYLYFYACPGKDSHTFAKTLGGQNRNIAKCK